MSRIFGLLVLILVWCLFPSLAFGKDQPDSEALYRSTQTEVMVPMADGVKLWGSDFEPMDAVEFWDLVNRQDWVVCEGVQRGMQTRVFEQGVVPVSRNDRRRLSAS